MHYSMVQEDGCPAMVHEFTMLRSTRVAMLQWKSYSENVAARHKTIALLTASSNTLAVVVFPASLEANRVILPKELRTLHSTSARSISVHRNVQKQRHNR